MRRGSLIESMGAPRTAEPKEPYRQAAQAARNILAAQHTESLLNDFGAGTIRADCHTLPVTTLPRAVHN
jgi:hypothetical protein